MSPLISCSPQTFSWIVGVILQKEVCVLRHRHGFRVDGAPGDFAVHGEPDVMLVAIVTRSKFVPDEPVPGQIWQKDAAGVGGKAHLMQSMSATTATDEDVREVGMPSSRGCGRLG